MLNKRVEIWMVRIHQLILFMYELFVSKFTIKVDLSLLSRIITGNEHHCESFFMITNDPCDRENDTLCMGRFPSFLDVFSESIVFDLHKLGIKLELR